MSLSSPLSSSPRWVATAFLPRRRFRVGTVVALVLFCLFRYGMVYQTMIRWDTESVTTTMMMGVTHGNADGTDLPILASTTSIGIDRNPYHHDVNPFLLGSRFNTVQSDHHYYYYYYDDNDRLQVTFRKGLQNHSPPPQQPSIPLTNNHTLVTAYYQLGTNRHNHHDYFTYMELLFSNHDPFIIFTSPDLVPNITALLWRVVEDDNDDDDDDQRNNHGRQNNNENTNTTTNITRTKRRQLLRPRPYTVIIPLPIEEMRVAQMVLGSSNNNNNNNNHHNNNSTTINNADINYNNNLQFWTDKIWHTPMGKRANIQDVHVLWLWNSKIDLLYRSAVEINPFQSTIFFWIDAGMVRGGSSSGGSTGNAGNNSVPEYTHTTLIQRIPPQLQEDQLLVLNITRLTHKQRQHMIGGGMFGGYINGIIRYYHAYYNDIMPNYGKAVSDIGTIQRLASEQHIMYDICITNPGLCLVVRPHRGHGYGGAVRWGMFFLLAFFNQQRYEQLERDGLIQTEFGDRTFD